MKKYLLPSLLAMMACSLPLAVQAQTSPSMGGTQTQPGSSTNLNSQQTTTPYSMQQSQGTTPSPYSGIGAQQQPMTPYSSQTGQMTTPDTGVSNQQSQLNTNTMQQTGQMSTPNMGVSQQQINTQSTVGQTTTTTTTTTQVSQIPMIPTSGEVIVGADSGSSIAPPLTVGLGTTTVTVVNPTPKPVTFTVPNLSLSYEVPANSERTIQIDRSQTASLTPGQSVAYYVNDASGNMIVSSNLSIYQTAVSQINTDTHVATETKTEPTYQSSTPTQKRSTVRGYW
jgi:hypothetical protein